MDEFANAQTILRFSKNNQKPGDFFNNEGLLICGNCHTPKQCNVNIIGETYTVFCMCKCELQKIECDKNKLEQEKTIERIKILRKMGITDTTYARGTFDMDDGKDKRTRNISEKYVENFKELSKKNIGLLFMGNVGIGKTFWACCIANALIDKGTSAFVTSMSKILNRIQGMGYGEDKNEFINSLQNYKLMVIDDFGIERNTEYVNEQIFNIIDARYRSNKPMIITTNLTSEDFKNRKDISLSRIYDRINECTVPIIVNGENKRKNISKSKYEQASDLLGL